MIQLLWFAACVLMTGYLASIDAPGWCIAVNVALDFAAFLSAVKALGK